MPLRLAVLALITAIYVSSGCHASDVTWSAEARSPDGKVTATARTVARSGFGTNFIYTTVSLDWTGDRRPADQVLNFIDETETPAKTMVGLNWLTPTHLEVTYSSPRHIGFQAIKWANIDISLRDLVSAP